MIKVIALFVLIYFTFGQASFPAATPNHLKSYQNCSPKCTMPLVSLGNKFYYFGTFYKASWYKAYQYCRFHGLQLATITTLEENEALTNYLLNKAPKEHFWISGTDWGSEGKFFWMSTGDSVKYADWWPGQPDNFKGPNGETQNCLCLWNPSGNGLRWNDCLCSSSLYFVCELCQ